MREIFQLDSLTASKIAAGEVVDKPFNVVKELLENSLDAGASKITVEIEDAGYTLIRITDNGRGVLREDLPMTICRFATSKARSVEDVYNISTFGFRGEALAAISSVSDFSLKSVRKGGEGAELIVSFGGKPVIKSAAIAEGTQVTVSNLFENIPVRKKFKKSDRASASEILKFLKQFSMVNPTAELVVFFDDVEVYRIYPNSSMLDVAKQGLGESDLFFKSVQVGDALINVCAASPAVQKKRRDAICLGVNGRVIKDAALNQAVVQAYHRRLPLGMYPAAVADMRFKPHEVDVNIHPAKLEVRFASGDSVFQMVKRAVEEALESWPLPSAPESAVLNDFTSRGAGLFRTEERDYSKTLSGGGAARTVYAYDITRDFQTVRTVPKSQGGADCVIPKESPYRVIGQLASMYILCEGREGELIILDQHIAHERVLYEKYMNKRANIIPTLNLFEPLIINTNLEEREFLMSVAEEMAFFGYTYEIFGVELKLVSVPVDILKHDVEKIFRGFVENAMLNKRSKHEDVTLLTMSCRNAVKAGERLNETEMQKITDDLFQTKNPYTCPHGRPIVFQIPAGELAKKFRRELREA